MIDTTPATHAGNGAQPAPATPVTPVTLALFDAAGEAHGLPPGHRRLAQLAATLYDAARAAGGDSPERAARDAALAAPADDMSHAEQAIAAAAAGLQRERPRPQREPALLGLRERDQQAALRLAALLRLAAALAERGAPAAVQASADGTLIAVGGADAASAAQLADQRGDLWRRAIGPLAVRPAADGDEPAPLAAPAEPAPPPAALPGPLRGGEDAAEGARRVLRRFFERLLAREEDVRKAEDPEDVHQMRVATRRLRASLQEVEGVFEPAAIREQRRRLQRVARALGHVRDTDVFLAAVLAHQQGLPEDQRAAMEPLAAAVRADRAPARKQLVAYLESRRYARFKRSFAALLTTPGAGLAPHPEAGAPPRIRDVAGSAIWRRYEQLRAFEVLLPGGPEEALHAARIAGKRLRYTLEFFADALGPRAEEALAPLAALQEALGALQDAVVAHDRVRALGLADDPGAQSFLAALDASSARGLADLPRAWEKVASATYRRRLFELIVKL